MSELNPLAVAGIAEATEKHEVEMIEKQPVPPDYVMIKSPFEDLNFFQTLKTFKVATLLAFLAAFSAAAE